MLNYRKLVLDILIIVTVIVVVQPVKTLIDDLMNMNSNLAWFGPILAVMVTFAAGFVVGNRIISIYENFKNLKK